MPRRPQSAANPPAEVYKRMKTVDIVIVGFGNVGRGVARVIAQKNQTFKKSGLNLRVVAVSDLWGSMVDERGLRLKDVLEMKCERKKMSGLDVINEVGYNILVESTPTNIDTGGPGLKHMKAALENKKYIATSNKGPLALQYAKLMSLARKKGVELRFEATVGGAMPIINLARETLAGNEIISIRGVLNGTTNYILTRMEQDGLPYEHVLSEAKEIGIAEADPTYDVGGIDAACKLVILANSIFDMDVSYKDVLVTGITWVTPEALLLASKAGYAVRLIAECRKDGTLKVAPRLVPRKSPLAVEGTLNAASLITDLAGEITITGKGAGSIEAASSILSDIMYIASRLQ